MQGADTIIAKMTRLVVQSMAGMALLATLSMPASAVTVTGLYSVEVPVKSSAPQDLAQGYADGLGRVFVRVSGTEAVLAQEGVAELLDNAESLLQSYQYLRSEEEGNKLQMSFGAVGVNRALASAGAPVWGANRPLTLAWIAVEQGGTRTLLHKTGPDEQTTSSWLAAFRQAAEDRGLPVNLPPESFADRRELMSDIWGQFTSSVRDVSGDLSHDLISLVRVSRSGGQWRAGWVFDGMDLGGPEQSVTAETPEALAAAVVGRWAEMFADRYAVEGSDVGESPQVDLVLHGIRGFEDFANANRVIKNLSPVEKANAVATRAEQLTLNVAFSGEIEQLKRYIALDPRFVPLTDAEVSRLPQPEEDGQADAKQNQSLASSTNQPVSETQTGPSFLSGQAGNRSANPLSVYEPLFSEQEESEKGFDSLYQVLHYRWQPASVVGGESSE